jgi:DNA anti-recombination protein RmuC
MEEAIQLSAVLQVVLFLASVEFVIVVVFCIWAILQLRKHVAQIMQELVELKAEVSLLVQDIRKMLQNLNKLSTHAQQEGTSGLGDAPAQ